MPGYAQQYQSFQTYGRHVCLTVDHTSVANEGNHGQNHGLRQMASSAIIEVPKRESKDLCVAVANTLPRAAI
jgi:hypothetical protein